MKLGAAMMVKGGADITQAMLCLDKALSPHAPICICEDGRTGSLHSDYIPGRPIDVDRTPFEMWTDRCIHMAHNRNRSIDLCPADWIFLLDADDLAGGPILEAVREADRRGANALMGTYIIYQGDQLVQRYTNPLAIRKGAVRYQFPVHNELLWIGEKRAHHDPRVTVTAHYPADPRARHPRSYPALLKLWREEDQHETTSREAERAHAAFFLTKLAAQRGYPARAFKWARRVVAIDPKRSGYVQARRTGALCAWSAHGIDAGLAFAWQGIKDLGWHPDLVHPIMAMLSHRADPAAMEAGEIPATVDFWKAISAESGRLGFGAKEE